MRKTNPIPGGAGGDGATGAQDAGQLCKTKPIPGDAHWDEAAGAGTEG